MTNEILISKVLTVLVPAPSLMFAAMDPATQMSLVNLGTLTVSTLGVVAGAWIAYRQNQLKKTVEVLEKNTNSMKDALVASTAKAGVSEGVLQEKNEEAKRKAAVAEGVAKAHQDEKNPPA